MKILYCIVLLIFSVSSFAENYSSVKTEQRDTYDFIQLKYDTNSDKSFKSIFEKQNLSNSNLRVLLVGKYSSYTNNELIDFYDNNFPAELNQALNSSGNLHNPAIQPFK